MRVLLVEDDADQRAMLVLFFTKSGHTVDALPSGFGVCNRAAGRDGTVPDVIVLDHQLPGLTGANLLSVLARDPAARSVPVVLHSAVDGPTIEEAVRAHPMCTFVPKSGRVRTLLQSMESLVASARATLPQTFGAVAEPR